MYFKRIHNVTEYAVFIALGQKCTEELRVKDNNKFRMWLIPVEGKRRAEREGSASVRPWDFNDALRNYPRVWRGLARGLTRSLANHSGMCDGTI